MPKSLYRPARYHVRKPQDFDVDDPVFEGHDAERRALMEASARHNINIDQPWGVHDGGIILWLFFQGDKFQRV